MQVRAGRGDADGPGAVHGACRGPATGEVAPILYKKVIGSKLSGSEVYYTASSLLVTLKNLCSELHRRIVLIQFPFYAQSTRARPSHYAGVKIDARTQLPTRDQKNAYCQASSCIQVLRDLPLSGVWSRPAGILGDRLCN